MNISPPPAGGGAPPPLPIPPCPVPLPRDVPRSLSAPMIPPTPELPPEQPLPPEEGRSPDGRFAPGWKGKPRGARNRVTLAIEAMMDGQWEVLTKTAIALALRGDPAALRLCIDRLAPPRRGRVTPIVDFPVPKTATEVPAALAHLTQAVASGEITAGEADEIAKLIDRFVAAFDAAAFAERLAELEKRIEASNGAR